ncbi:MAG: rhodanese-like domain-containing protein [Bacteroidales bacterium]|nr:rhodanese-like domain-containing protein [Bacteroidales bacterium]
MKQLLLCSLLVFFGNLLMAQTVTKVTSLEAYPLMKKANNEQSIIIDGRSPSMYNSGHIKNAIQINAFSEDAAKKLARYVNKKQIIVYCTTNNRSQTLIKKLKRLGYRGEIIFITDGIKGWKSHGLKTIPETDETVSKSKKEKES